MPDWNGKILNNWDEQVPLLCLDRARIWYKRQSRCGPPAAPAWRSSRWRAPEPSFCTPGDRSEQPSSLRRPLLPDHCLCAPPWRRERLWCRRALGRPGSRRVFNMQQQTLRQGDRIVNPIRRFLGSAIPRPGKVLGCRRARREHRAARGITQAFPIGAARAQRGGPVKQAEEASFVDLIACERDCRSCSYAAGLDCDGNCGLCPHNGVLPLREPRRRPKQDRAAARRAAPDAPAGSAGPELGGSHRRVRDLAERIRSTSGHL